MDAHETESWLNLFEQAGRVYQKRMVDSWWDCFPNRGSEPLESLRIFLVGYAFERQGAPSSYAPIAGEALKQAKSFPLDPNEVWELFKQESGGIGLNEARHPLAPQGTEYKTKSGKPRKTTQKSAIEFANEINAPLIEWVRGGLERNAESINLGLRSISGVGTKIAPYFMRDVACRFNCFPVDWTQRHLLQPIDIWVRRSAEAFGAPTAPIDDPRSTADFIVHQSHDAGVSPERVNQGMWYFAAEIGETEYYLNKLLADPRGIDRAWNDLRNHLRSLSSAGSLLGCLEPLVTCEANHISRA